MKLFFQFRTVLDSRYINMRAAAIHRRYLIMIMNIYTNEGWLNIPAIAKEEQFIKCIIGGRGIGKTYGVLNYAYQTNEKFVLLRTTQTEADFLFNDDFNPFKSLNRDNGYDVHCERLNNYMGIFYIVIDNIKKIIGYVLALSTISKIRGFDSSDVTNIIFDEFIPESHVHKIKNSGIALLNAYETINRNRELKGEKPCTLWLLSNANDINSDILLELNILPLHDKIKNSVACNKHVLLIEPENSPISESKSKTGIYSLSITFNKMAINNKFAGHYEGNIKSMTLKNCALWVMYDNLCFYTFKDNNLTYCTQYKRKNDKPLYKYGDSDFEKKKFKIECSWLLKLYLSGNMYFENTKCELLFNRIWE